MWQRKSFGCLLHVPRPGPGIRPAIQVCALTWKLKLQPFCGWIGTLTTEKTGQGFLSPFEWGSCFNFYNGGKGQQRRKRQWNFLCQLNSTRPGSSQLLWEMKLRSLPCRWLLNIEHFTQDFERNESVLPRVVFKCEFFFQKKKENLERCVFPCKQNREKGIIVGTMSIKPQTRKIHKMDWWLGKCNIMSKVQTVSNQSKLQPLQQWTAPEILVKTAWPALRQGDHCWRYVDHPTKSTGEAVGFGLHLVWSTCIIGPISE